MKTFWTHIRPTNSIFLIGTFVTTLTAAPLYIWHYGLDSFQIALFLFFLISTGLSITLGYHRLFSHLTFQAGWPVRLFTLLFGAAAFEGSALEWCADHRRHHKFVDHEEDPYDISKGLFHAHIGWLLFRTGPETPLTWVRDLQKDSLAWWQHKHYVSVAIAISFALPAAFGWAWGGPVAAVGAFLIAGVARIVVVHHMTFCINSLCHWIGDRPYSSDCTARDSILMAVCTFGEGYHNFHHEFQHDYRNGVKPWQFDPTKWTIWLLSKVGLTRGLRTVPEEKILKAQIAEQDRRMQAHIAQHPLTNPIPAPLEKARARLNNALERWESLLVQYRAAVDHRGEISRRELRQLKRDVRAAAVQMRESLRHWVRTHRTLPDMSA